MADSSSGEQIAATAYALPTLSPQGLSLGIVVVSILLGIVTTTVVALRIWVRTGLSGALDKIWNTEDYLLVIGFAPFLPSVIFGILAAYHGVGLRDVRLPSPLYVIRAGEYIIYWELLYFISSTIVKSAIGFTCMRIDRRKRVIYPISLNIFVVAVTAILALVYVFGNCKPFAATWNPGLGVCKNVISLEHVSYIVSAVQALTDWICAVIPCYIVSTLQMPRRRKISVICILGIGILASLATIVRLPYLKYYNTAKHPTDFLYHLGVILLCSSVECSLGIIACSLPPLRKLLNIYCKGWSSYRKDTQGINIDNSSIKPTQLSSLNPRTKYTSQDHSRILNGKWDRLEDEESRRGIIVQRSEISIRIEDEESILRVK